jgi:Helicase conserved C-terminal domain
MQRYFDPKGLEDRGIGHFDAWAATFGEVVDTMEISPDGATLRPRSRFAKFTNLPELVQMFRAYADVLTAGDLKLPVPALEGGKPQTIACPMSEEQKELQAGLIERYDRLRSSKVDPREDNALAITTDGRKLALDGRMLHGSEDFPGSKINALVRGTVETWRKSERNTQMIFCDMGINPNPFSAYDEIAWKLQESGIPASQIAVMGDADTDAKKQALFEKVRQGTVRVLIGSTAKMGTGTNVQKRLVALHHLDAPWKPAEVEQREGRILRQGNTNKEVAIYRFVTEGSFDAFMWQALETKARFIAQVMSGDCAIRKAEDIGGQELSYAEVKAIASGNPAVLTLAETDAELQRLAILRKNHYDEQFLARRNKIELPGEIKRKMDRLAGLEADMATMASSDAIPSQEAVGARMSRMPEKVDKTYHTKLGTYRGLECGMILHPLGGTEVYLDGAVRCREQLMRDNPGPRAVLNALARLADGYESDIVHLKAEIAVKEGQLKDYESRLGKPFEHEEYASQLADLRDQLKMGLSEHAPEGGTPVPELAEKIQALRASVTVEAAPERVNRKALRAERPVTARIRERRGEVQEVKVEAVEVKPETVVIQFPEPPKPVEDYRQSVVRRRQGDGRQMSLF